MIFLPTIFIQPEPPKAVVVVDQSTERNGAGIALLQMRLKQYLDEAGYVQKMLVLPDGTLRNLMPIAKAIAEDNPSLIILVVGSGEARTGVWEKQKGTLVSRYRSFLDTISHVGEFDRRPTFVVTPLFADLSPSEAETLQVGVGPLARQAANEAGVAYIDLGRELGPWKSLGDEQLVHAADWIAWKAFKRPFGKHGWQIVGTPSQEEDEGPASNAIDGDPTTYWHTRYSPEPDPYPHELVVNMVAAKSVSGFRYWPRTNKGNGTVKVFEFYTSLDGSQWDLASKGSWASIPGDYVEVKFSARKAQYFRFKALSERNGGPWTSAGEIDILSP